MVSHNLVLNSFPLLLLLLSPFSSISASVCVMVCVVGEDGRDTPRLPLVVERRWKQENFKENTSLF